MIAEIIAAGSEMLTPYRQDTNSLYLTEGLNDLGVQVAFKTIVGDNLAHLTSAARIAISRADIVIFSGGLGPTEDDLTREAVAAALGIGIHADNAVLDLALQALRRPPDGHAAQQRQAGRRPRRSDRSRQHERQRPRPVSRHHVLDATAAIRKIVILLPGPPKELKPLFDKR